MSDPTVTDSAAVPTPRKYGEEETAGRERKAGGSMREAGVPMREAGSLIRDAGGLMREAGVPEREVGDPEGQARGDSRRPGGGPIMTGDLLGGRRVLGFGHVEGAAPSADSRYSASAASSASGAEEAGARFADRLLLDGDQHADGPPARSADPADHPTLERAGPPPYHQLDDRHVHHADDLAPGLVTAFERLLYGPDAAGYLGVLVDRLTADGHSVWLAGGVPRDLVTGAVSDTASIEGTAGVPDPPHDPRTEAAPATAHDLDATGTAPAGAFLTIVDEVLLLDGDSAELPRLFSPRSLVCSVLAVRRDRRTLEYRGLGLTGMPYPATGTDLLQDARQRDLTVNTLLYDPVRRLVLDPLGRALTDLGHHAEATPRPLRLALPGTPERPDVCAELLLRAAKFRIRWDARAGLDDTALGAWAADLPADLAARLDGGPEGLPRLAGLWEAWVPGGPTAAQAESLRAYGPAMSGLLDRLAAPTRQENPGHPAERARPDERGTW